MESGKVMIHTVFFYEINRRRSMLFVKIHTSSAAHVTKLQRDHILWLISWFNSQFSFAKLKQAKILVCLSFYPITVY